MFDLEDSKNRKRRFLESDFFSDNEIIKTNAQYFFNKAEVLEIQEGMDLIQFNIDRVYRLFKYYNSRSKGYLNLVASIFNKYFSFCMYEGFIDSKDVKNLYAPEIIKSIIDDVIPVNLLEEKVFTKEKLESYENFIDDNILKLLIYCPFYGIWGDEYNDIIKLKLTDLNKGNMTIVTESGLKIKVDDHFINLMENANKETWYHPEGSNSDNYRDRRTYNESDYIFKTIGTKSDTISKNVISSRFRDLQRIIENKQITCGNLYLSGLICYIKNRFSEKNITLEQAFNASGIKGNLYEDQIQEYIYEFGSNITARMLRYRTKDIIDLYY